MDIPLLALHVVVGLLFAGHGAQKLFGVFGGNGIAGTAGFFESIGLRPGRLHATAAGLAELLGGVLLALGLLVPVAAGFLIATMVAAIATVHGSNGPWATDGGWEYNAVLVAVLFALAGVGPGAYALDAGLGLELAGTGPALIALALGLAGGIGAVLSGRLAPQRRGSTHAV